MKKIYLLSFLFLLSCTTFTYEQVFLDPLIGSTKSELLDRYKKKVEYENKYCPSVLCKKEKFYTPTMYKGSSSDEEIVEFLDVEESVCGNDSSVIEYKGAGMCLFTQVKKCTNVFTLKNGKVFNYTRKGDGCDLKNNIYLESGKTYIRNKVYGIVDSKK